MTKSSFQTCGWYEALPLTERLASLRENGDQRPNTDQGSELADQRLQRWREMPPFTTDTHFQQRLLAAGISESEFRDLLGEPIEAVRARSRTSPAWLETLEEAFSRAVSFDTMPLPAALKDEPTSGFLAAIQPLITQGRERLHQGIAALSQRHASLPFEKETIETILFANLPGPLLTLLSRTMTLELHVARLGGLLQGETPEERFQSFIEHIRQPDVALALLTEYPVLARQLTVCIDRWVAFSLEFLGHLCADWDAIQARFSPDNHPGMLKQAQGGAGDTHRGGSSVMIAQFSSGFQVVYKPKSLDVDVHFQELLDWLNQRGDHPPFRTVKVLPRGDYGWVEFVETEGCASTAEVQRFYERQGGYLALLHVLQATDFHAENLIAAGEHPVLIDLESLFHLEIGGNDNNPSNTLARQTWGNSVLRIGLLPQRLWANDDHVGIDISGLGGIEGQLTPSGVPRWEDAGTDEMQFTRKRVKINGSNNRPTLNGEEIDTLDYVAELVSGFTKVYRLLLSHRDAFLADDGPMARFDQDEIRVILRGTRTYWKLLYESNHPDLLRNGLARDRHFDNLWLAVENLPHLAKVIPAEHEDLWAGDIPMFTTFPNSRHIWAGSERRIDNFCDESGMIRVRRHVERLSASDLAQQLWFIRASLTTLAQAENAPKRNSDRLRGPETIATRANLLTAARAAGDWLEAHAAQGDDDATWIGLSMTQDRYWSIVPSETDLYSGLSGIALFLGYLGELTDETRYTKLAQAALTTLQRQLKEIKDKRVGESRQLALTAIGGFGGWGGVIYTLTHLGVLWNRPNLLAEAEEIVALLPELVSGDKTFDIIGGAAGCIVSLLSLYKSLPSARTLDVAMQCGDHLIKRAHSLETGIGWMPESDEFIQKPLTGFSHGAAGIAWALLELAHLTGETRFRMAALEAIAYERSFFSPEAGNWPDLRTPPDQGTEKGGEQTFRTLWCHGAPGIGLARLRSLPYLDDAETRAEIEIALKTTLTQGFGSSHCLCHGDIGNLELLLQASQTLADPQWGEHVQRIASTTLTSMGQQGWLCGNPLRVEEPGLMTGVAGIGFGLLRLAFPEHVPSVLVLEAPIANQ